jgi:SOS-response transcriptional repressor LexA
MTATTEPATRPALTDRQRLVLQHIVRFTADTGHPPSVRQICALTGISSPNGVTAHLRALARGGYIECSRQKDGDGVTARGVTVPELRAAQYAAGVAYLERLAG